VNGYLKGMFNWSAKCSSIRL